MDFACCPPGTRVPSATAIFCGGGCATSASIMAVMILRSKAKWACVQLSSLSLCTHLRVRIPQRFFYRAEPSAHQSISYPNRH